MKRLTLDKQIPRNALAWIIGAQFVLLLAEGALLFRRRREAPALSHRRRADAGPT